MDDPEKLTLVEYFIVAAGLRPEKYPTERGKVEEFERLLTEALRAAADGARREAVPLFESVIRTADSGLWRDKTDLSLAAHPVIDKIRAFLSGVPSPDPVAAAREANDIPIGLLLRTLAHFGDREDPLVHDIRTFLELSGIPIRKDKIN